MEIKIGKYEITREDENNITLSVWKNSIDKKTKEEKQRLVLIGYYITIEGALISLTRHSLSHEDILTSSELLSSIRKLENLVIDIFKKEQN